MVRHEEEIVALIRDAFDDSGVVVGIGDDAAVVNVSGQVVITTDVLVEDVDFTAEMPLELIAHKSLTANVSDLAAMGAAPDTFVLGLVIPESFRARIESFARALGESARRYGIRLVGGDLSAGAKFTVAITAIGKVTSRTLLRGSAKVGDRIFVSRPLGGAAAGLALWQKGWRLDARFDAVAPSAAPGSYAEREFAAAALRQFLSPTAESALGARLVDDERVHACIDISDGLSSDLRRICEASDVAARIEWERIPLFPELDKVGRLLGVGVEDAALHGGEEFALLFTSSARESELSARFGRPVYAIGVIERGSGVTLVRNGAEVPLADYGFDHFRR